MLASASSPLSSPPSVRLPGFIDAMRRRATLIFLRVQQRVVGPVLLAVVLSLLVVSVIPAFNYSCWGSVDSQMGNLPVDMALTTAAVVLGIL